MTDRFIGIENEFTSFKNGEPVDFSSYFPHFRNNGDHVKSDFAIRTRTGHGYYVDGDELELLTPPVALNNGFSTRLTDLLLIGRERIANTELGLEHTGYSMHWNLTRQRGSFEWFFEGVIIPFHLFGLTPISYGLGVRKKNNPTRYEVLGDHISNEKQLNATALLLGAYEGAIANAERTPLIPVGKQASLCPIISFLENRETPVEVYIPTAQFKGEISAQEYLELFYQWIEPFVKSLGSKNEVANLESFVDGAQQLEFDLAEYYGQIEESGKKDGTIYQPTCPHYSEEISGPALRTTGEKRKTPLEGRLLGAIVSKVGRRVEQLDWETFVGRDERQFAVYGTTEIFEYASTLGDKLPSFLGMLDLSEVTPNEVLSYAEKMRLYPNVREGSVNPDGVEVESLEILRLRYRQMDADLTEEYGEEPPDSLAEELRELRREANASLERMAVIAEQAKLRDRPASLEEAQQLLGEANESARQLEEVGAQYRERIYEARRSRREAEVKQYEDNRELGQPSMWYGHGKTFRRIPREENVDINRSFREEPPREFIHYDLSRVDRIIANFGERRGQGRAERENPDDEHPNHEPVPQNWETFIHEPHPHYATDSDQNHYVPFSHGPGREPLREYNFIEDIVERPHTPNYESGEPSTEYELEIREPPEGPERPTRIQTFLRFLRRER